MTSITWLRDRKEEIERMMDEVSEEIETLENEIKTKQIRIKDRINTFNRLDEETIEFNEAIVLLEENDFKDLDKRNEETNA